MAFGVLENAVSGLLAFQQSMATISHNISNVNTEGYSRQRADLATMDPMSIGQAGYLGTGVHVASVRRSYDQFLTTQINTSTSLSAQLDTYNSMLSQIDNFIANPQSSLPSAFTNFFNSVNNLANDPTSIPVRQGVLTSAKSLIDRFTSTSGQLDQLRQQSDQAMTDSINQINAIAGNIAAINQRIFEATKTSGGSPPNDLLDQRDQMLANLSKEVGIQVIPDNHGQINVLIGSGQALVTGNIAGKLQTANSPFVGAPKDVLLVPHGAKASINISDKIAGGNLGGYRQFINDALNPVQNDIGRIAVGLAHAFNEQLKAGTDLNGNPGTAMFSEPPISIIANSNNASATPVSAVFSDYTQLTGSDYQINVTATNTVVTNLRTQQVTKFASPSNLQFSLEGIDFNLSGSVAGDSYLIQPTRNAASSLTMTMDVINDADKIAAAASSPTPIPGDNANALSLANLQLAKTSLKQGSFQDAYNEVIGTVGVLTQASQTDATAQKQLLTSVQQQRDSVSGVNLDEEAANLILFQQAYQASAQVISVAKSTFDSLLAAVR